MWDILTGLLGNIYQWDTSLFYFINLNLQNYYFNATMPIITNAGTNTFWLVICVILFVFGGEKAKKAAVLCVMALTLGYFLSEFLKYAVDRPRPDTVLSGVHLLSNINGGSFPSGHSITSFAACTMLGVKLGYLYIFLLLASLVAFSRIYLGVHYPSDVIVGALIGVLCSLLILKWEDPIWEQILKFKSKWIHKS
jgi:undecaprenyl-diphosphatase